MNIFYTVDRMSFLQFSMRTHIYQWGQRGYETMHCYLYRLQGYLSFDVNEFFLAQKRDSSCLSAGTTRICGHLR